MEKIEFTVAKSEVVVICNRFLYGENLKPQTKGDFLEAYLRRYFNPTDKTWYKKNSTSYDMASDIETSTNDGISVKSGQFSLTEKLTTEEYTEAEKKRIIEEYEKTVHSNKVAYMWISNEDEEKYYISTVIVNMNTFVKFLKDNAVMTKVTGMKKYKVKVKKTTSTVVNELTKIENEKII